MGLLFGCRLFWRYLATLRSFSSTTKISRLSSVKTAPLPVLTILGRLYRLVSDVFPLLLLRLPHPAPVRLIDHGAVLSCLTL